MMEEAVKKNMEIKEDKILSLQSRYNSKIVFCIKKIQSVGLKLISFVLFKVWLKYYMLFTYKVLQGTNLCLVTNL
jgi:hypothetical protein